MDVMSLGAITLFSYLNAKNVLTSCSCRAIRRVYVIIVIEIISISVKELIKGGPDGTTTRMMSSN